MGTGLRGAGQALFAGGHGRGGMMEETGGNQRSQRGEDGREALSEGFHGHETNVERLAPRVKEKKQTLGCNTVG